MAGISKMYLKSFLNDINLHSKDKGYLIILLCFSLLLTYSMIKFHQTRGAINSDIFIYLASALDFAGLNVNHISDLSWIHNSPVIFFLTSLLFRLGLVDITAIFIVTGIFGIIGIFGMYVFLKMRFSPLLSFTGAILYSSFSLTLYYFANGMLDTSAVAILMWTLIFTVAAVNRNPKYYVLVAIFFIISVFIRFTNTYIIALIVLFMLKNHDMINLAECLFKNTNLFKQRVIGFFKSSEFKWILISSIFGIFSVSFVFYVILSMGGQLGYFMMANSSLSHLNYVNNYNYFPDKLFYVKYFVSLLFCNNITFYGMIEKFINPSPLSYVILSILFGGIIIKIINACKNIDFFKNNKIDLECRTNNSFKLLMGLAVILFIVAIVGFKVNYLVTVFCFWLMFIILMSLAKQYPINNNNFALAVMSIALFVFYLVIFSYMDLKCVRYILPTFPGFVYLTILALETILNFIKSGWDDERILSSKSKGNYGELYKSKSNLRGNLSKCIPVLLILICLFMVFNFTNTVDECDNAIFIDEGANFLINYDHNLSSKSIACTYGDMFFEWYFKEDMDILSKDKLDSANQDYIITDFEWDNENYKEIYDKGCVIIYERY